MSSTRNKKASTAGNFPNRLNELAMAKAELEAYHKNPDDAPVFVLSDSSKFIRFLKTNKTYELNAETAFEEMMIDLPCEPGEIRDYLEHVLEDLTEFVLEHIDAPEFRRHRKMLRSVGYFFANYLRECKERPRAH